MTVVTVEVDPSPDVHAADLRYLEAHPEAVDLCRLTVPADAPYWRALVRPDDPRLTDVSADVDMDADLLAWAATTAPAAHVAIAITRVYRRGRLGVGPVGPPFTRRAGPSSVLADDLPRAIRERVRDGRVVMPSTGSIRLIGTEGPGWVAP